MHTVDFRIEPWLARGDFGGGGFLVQAALAAYLKLEVFDGVRYVDVGAVDTGFCKGAVKELAARSDEGVSHEIFFVAGLLTDHEDSGMPPAFSEDGLRRAEIKVAPATVPDFGTQFPEACAVWNEFRCAWEFSHDQSRKQSIRQQ
jgi:hypothetical protein